MRLGEAATRSVCAPQAVVAPWALIPPHLAHRQYTLYRCTRLTVLDFRKVKLKVCSAAQQPAQLSRHLSSAHSLAACSSDLQQQQPCRAQRELQLEAYQEMQLALLTLWPAELCSPQTH